MKKWIFENLIEDEVDLMGWIAMGFAVAYFGIHLVVGIIMGWLPL